MTDKELIERLRMIHGWKIVKYAADRIEELVIEVDETHKEAMEWIAKWGTALGAQREVAAKLTKALAALDEAIYMLNPDEEDMAKKAGVYRIVTTYKELKGET